MSTHKNINRICVAAIILALFLTFIIGNIGHKIENSSSTKLAYEAKLFDSSKVHTIDIKMDDWDSFIETCEEEEYMNCTVVIDQEAYKNVGIRAKGNTSLSSVAASGNDRYSFKIEFDQYQDGNTYYGLDKLSLNNVIQDNTYMKDYLTYQMMTDFGVDSPLCSYVYITVNGEDWGLYLAVEAVEESFLSRNYGNNYGDLYKPDSLSMGAGNDKEKDFDSSQIPQQGELPEGFDASQMPQQGEMPEGFDRSNIAGGFAGMGSDDVKLQYIDEDPDSYSNIFDNAKTKISTADQTRLINSLNKLSKQEDIENVVDVDEVIRYFVVHNFVCNSDSYTGSMIHNYYLYEDEGTLSMIPWDYNLAFGSFQASSDATSIINDPIDSPLSTGSQDDRPMFSWITSNPEYIERYHQYFSEFIQQYFSSGYLTQFISDTKEMIAPYVQKDPTKFCTYEEFELGVTTIEEFCKLRAESVSGQLSALISSSSTAQKEHSDNLVDGSSLNISAMGTMNQGGGGGFPNKGSMNNVSETDTNASGTESDTSGIETNVSVTESDTSGIETNASGTETDTSTTDAEMNDKTQSSSSDSSQDNAVHQPELSGSQGDITQPPSTSFRQDMQTPSESNSQEMQAPSTSNSQEMQAPSTSDNQGMQAPSSGDSIGAEAGQSSSLDGQSGRTQNSSSGESQGNRTQQRPRNMNQNQEDWNGFQGGNNNMNKQSINQSAVIELIASIIILLAGIIVAKKYKRVKI